MNSAMNRLAAQELFDRVKPCFDDIHARRKRQAHIARSTKGVTCHKSHVSVFEQCCAKITAVRDFGTTTEFAAFVVVVVAVAKWAKW